FHVTGVQTCALPISYNAGPPGRQTLIQTVRHDTHVNGAPRRGTERCWNAEYSLALWPPCRVHTMRGAVALSRPLKNPLPNGLRRLMSKIRVFAKRPCSDLGAHEGLFPGRFARFGRTYPTASRMMRVPPATDAARAHQIVGGNAQ